MKSLTKHIECGKYSFDVVINRDIAVKAMEEYPDLAEYVFNQAKKEIKEKDNGKKDEIDILVANIKSKQTSEMFRQEELLKECVKFAFPLMLKESGCAYDAKEIIDYIYENGVEDDFNAAMYELILLGFTQREVSTKPKVNFSMK